MGAVRGSTESDTLRDEVREANSKVDEIRRGIKVRDTAKKWEKVIKAAADDNTRYMWKSIRSARGDTRRDIPSCMKINRDGLDQLSAWTERYSEVAGTAPDISDSSLRHEVNNRIIEAFRPQHDGHGYNSDLSCQDFKAAKKRLKRHKSPSPVDKVMNDMLLDGGGRLDEIILLIFRTI